MCVRACVCVCSHDSRETWLRERPEYDGGVVGASRKFRTAVAVRRDKPPFGRDDPVKAKELSRRRSRRAVSTTRSDVILRRCFRLLIIRHYATYIRKSGEVGYREQDAGQGGSDSARTRLLRLLAA